MVYSLAVDLADLWAVSMADSRVVMQVVNWVGQKVDYLAWTLE